MLFSSNKVTSLIPNNVTNSLLTSVYFYLFLWRFLKFNLLLNFIVFYTQLENTSLMQQQVGANKAEPEGHWRCLACAHMAKEEASMS